MPTDKQEVQNFIQKVWKMVNAPNTDNLIHWNRETGKSFVITNQTDFAKLVLPLYFKHQNMPSFIRQLNMYGFRKVMNVDHMGLATANEEIEFMHSYFQKNLPEKLKDIKRKIPNKAEIAPLKLDDVQDIYSEIESIKMKQAQFQQFLHQLRNQNQVLWSELRHERQKHEQQQALVNKMFGFLVSIVKNKKVVFDQGVKRKAPMLLDTDSSPNKVAKNNAVDDAAFQATSPNVPGPQIYEICDESGVSLPQGSPMPVMSPGGFVDNSSATQQPQQQQQAFQIPAQMALPIPAISGPIEQSSIDIQQQQQEQQQQSEQQPEETLNNSPEDLLNLAMEELKNENFVDESLGNVIPEPGKNVSGADSTPVTDLVPTNAANLSLVPNYQEFQDHIDGLDTELDWLGDQIRNFSDFDYDPIFMEMYKYDDIHNQEQQYQMNQAIANNTIERPLQTPPKQPQSDNNTGDIPAPSAENDNLFGFDNLSGSVPLQSGQDTMDSKFLDDFSLGDLNEEETKSILDNFFKQAFD